MAKMKIPKRIAGYKVPKPIRRSALLKGLLGSKMGREIAGQALVAGATAAAAVLVAERKEVADATRKGARKGARTLGLLGEAVESAAGAATDVVTEAARAMLPDKDRGKPAGKPGKRKARSDEAALRH